MRKFVPNPAFVLAVIAIAVLAGGELAGTDWLSPGLRHLIYTVVGIAGTVGAVQGLMAGWRRTDDELLSKAMEIGRKAERLDSSDTVRQLPRRTDS